MHGCPDALGLGHRSAKVFFAAVVVSNGAGKTTLLNMLVGLLPASEGELRVAGLRPSNRPTFLARIGFFAQECPLYREFTVADLLRFGAAMNPGWDDGV